MKLSPEQIDALYAFTRAHFVEYYDLQTELVDHLAHAIEAESVLSPALSFDQLLNAEFKKFGIFGFSDIVAKRQGAMTRKYNRLVARHFLEFFRIPKIVMTFGIFTVIFFTLKLLPEKETAFCIAYGLLTVGLFIEMIRKAIRARRKIKDKNEKRWLFEEIIRNSGNISMFLLTPIQVLSYFYNDVPEFFTNDISLAAGSFFLACYGVASYVMLVVIPSKAEQYLRETYPEYALEKL